MIFAGLILLLFMKWAWASGIFLGDGVSVLGTASRNHPRFPGPVYLLLDQSGCKEAWMFLTARTAGDLGRYSAK